jgi:membrane protein implicated in regulation of membrane protease activity
MNDVRSFDLALPAGASLILSTVALLLFPRIATLACQFLAGLLLIGLFASRRLLRYVRKRRANQMNEPLISRWPLDRGDVLLLIGFAAMYAAVSGSLLRAGWPLEAVRSCAFLMLLSILLLRPKIAARMKAKTRECAPLLESSAANPAGLDVTPAVVSSKERIQ